jgi:hypothetical protein
MSQAEPITPETGVVAEPATVHGPEVPEPRPVDAEAEFTGLCTGARPGCRRLLTTSSLSRAAAQAAGGGRGVCLNCLRCGS